MNPYEVLGVAKEADADTIKKAFRKGIREVHPDHNPDGSQESAAAVNDAWAILGDAERKARFDATGDGAQPLPREAVAKAAMIHLFTQVIGAGLTGNILEQTRKRAVSEKQNQHISVLPMKTRIRELEAAIKKMKVKNGGENYLTAAMEQQKQQVEDLLKKAEATIQLMSDVLEQLNQYEYEMEKSVADSGSGRIRDLGAASHDSRLRS